MSSEPALPTQLLTSGESSVSEPRQIARGLAPCGRPASLQAKKPAPYRGLTYPQSRDDPADCLGEV